MNPKPILFNGDMVRALLDGRKTQTRRVVKPQPPEDVCLYGASSGVFLWEGGDAQQVERGELSMGDVKCPFGRPGDLLWVREAWNAIRFSTDYETGICDEVFTAPRIPTGPNDLDGRYEIAYAADLPDEGVEDRGFAFRPSIHMPRWASRITLRITDVRVERLQDISDDDAMAEGIDAKDVPTGGDDYQDYYRDYSKPRDEAEHPWIEGYPCESFRTLWESTGGDWDANPWVWVIAFEVIRKNIDEVTQ